VNTGTAWQLVAITVGSVLGGTLGSQFGDSERVRTNRAISVGAQGAIGAAWLAAPRPAPRHPTVPAGQMFPSGQKPAVRLT
jgi:hypothetical protein